MASICLCFALYGPATVLKPPCDGIVYRVLYNDHSACCDLPRTCTAVTPSSGERRERDRVRRREVTRALAYSTNLVFPLCPISSVLTSAHSLCPVPQL
ncbi:hypothetical protein C8R47DRAFT_1170229 [Mycena vitilis]|nr:hypothetical protein C8R47DRAFT_1170229 [Mycena vitilis]